MAPFVQVLFDKIRPYRVTIVAVICFLLFAAFSFYAYNRYMKPTLIKKEKGYDDIANRSKSGGGDLEILFFHADWCPHCKRAAPEWEKFYKEYNGQKIGGYIIKCTDVNCTDEDDNISNNLLNKYKIEGFPTILALMDGKEVTFDAKVTEDNLESFVKNLAGVN